MKNERVEENIVSSVQVNGLVLGFTVVVALVMVVLGIVLHGR